MEAGPTSDISSPTPSSLTSSFVVLSEHHNSSTTQVTSYDSDDEIVYSVSDDLLCASSPSDDDFVVLSRPKSLKDAPRSGVTTPSAADNIQSPDTEGLVTDLAKLTVSNLGSLASGKKPQEGSPRDREAAPGRKSARKVAAAKAAADSHLSLATSPTLPTPASKTAQHKAKLKPKKKKKGKRAVTSAPDFTTRSVVDDVSERLSTNGDAESAVGVPSVYEEAVGFITSFLSNPAARNDSACRLTLLQALIIELGLATPSLPVSLRSATAFLKSHAFLNVKEYLAVRGQGPAAVRRIMYPSRSALVKDIRKKNNKVSLQKVKESGLQVLLVSCYHSATKV